jgi:hypothetical protein
MEISRQVFVEGEYYHESGVDRGEAAVAPGCGDKSDQKKNRIQTRERREKVGGNGVERRFKTLSVSS